MATLVSKSLLRIGNGSTHVLPRGRWSPAPFDSRLTGPDFDVAMAQGLSDDVTHLVPARQGGEALESAAVTAVGTVPLDTRLIGQLRDLFGADGLHDAVRDAVDAHVKRWRHLRALDGWLEELDRERGPVPPDVQEWAARAYAGAGVPEPDSGDSTEA